MPQIQLDATLFATAFDADAVGGAASVVLPVVAVLAVGYLAPRAPRFGTLLGRVLHIDLLPRVMGRLLVAVLAVQLVASAVESWVRTGVS